MCDSVITLCPLLLSIVIVFRKHLHFNLLFWSHMANRNEISLNVYWMVLYKIYVNLSEFQHWKKRQKGTNLCVFKYCKFRNFCDVFIDAKNATGWRLEQLNLAIWYTFLGFCTNNLIIILWLCINKNTLVSIHKLVFWNEVTWCELLIVFGNSFLL